MPPKIASNTLRSVRSSCARRLLPDKARTMIAPSTVVKTAWPLLPVFEPASMAVIRFTLSCRRYKGLAAFWRRSGRFCGTVAQSGLIQESANAGNDRCIGEVKDIPVKAPTGYVQMEKDEI